MNRFIKFPSMGQAIVPIVISVLGLLMLIPLRNIFQINIRNLLVDIAVVGQVSPISGFLSTMGILTWCTAAAISMFTAFVIHRKDSHRKFHFFLLSSLFTIILLLDDLFMMHDHIIKKLFGARENIFYVTYIVIAILFVITFRNEIFQTNSMSLFIALGLMGASITCDYLTDISVLTPGKWEYLVEDGLKWIGIVWWCSYFLQTGFGTIRQMLDPKKLPIPENSEGVIIQASSND